MWGWNASTKTRLWSLEAVRNTVSGPGGYNNHCFGWGSRRVSWLCEIWRCFHKSSWAYPMCCISFPDLNGIKVIPGKICGSCNCVSHAYHKICGSHKTCWASSKFVSLSCPDPSGKLFFVVPAERSKICQSWGPSSNFLKLTMKRCWLCFSWWVIYYSYAYSYAINTLLSQPWWIDALLWLAIGYTSMSQHHIFKIFIIIHVMDIQIWVWVKIRYPNNWMVNTKLD